MNLQEALQQLLTFDNSYQALAFGVILLLTFLLGILLWTLLMHWPKIRKKNKALQEQKEQIAALESQNQELEDKCTVQLAKLQRLEEEAIAQDLKLSETTEKLTQTEQLYAHLEKDRDERHREAETANVELGELKKLFQFAQIEIQEATELAENASLAQQKAEEQVEAMKELIEEIEQDRQLVLQDKEEIVDELEALRALLEDAQIDKEELQEDLGEALNQLVIFHENQDFNVLDEHKELREEFAQLLEAFQSLDQENSKATERLNEIDSQEQALKKAREEEEQQMDQLFEKAQAALQEQGLFNDLEEGTLIENAELLQTKLAATTESNDSKDLQEAPALPEIEEQEEEMMDEALETAEQAMNLQGFFQPVEKAVLTAEETESLDEDELMDQALEQSAALMDDHPFFTDLEESELVEDMELLESQLAQEPEESDLDLMDEEVLEFSDEELELMNRALESASLALSSEGLYNTINAEKLLEPKEEQPYLTDIVVNPKYKTALEQAVVSELGRNIPKANEMDKDDLKKINGIGAFIEEKLNYLGFYTYHQIAQLSYKEYLKKLTAVLGIAEDAVERDQWVLQAKQLITQQKISDLKKDTDLKKLFKK